VILLHQQRFFRDLLESTRALDIKKVKCFISYEWPTEITKREALQMFLEKMKDDLRRVGIEVMLDIHNMEGDIDSYMEKGIKSSDRVLLICTPRLVQRLNDIAPKPNNLQKEIKAALEKQKVSPKFIIPLILEGDWEASMPKTIPNILALDFTKSEEYYERMVYVSPKGLIPMILGLEDSAAYNGMVLGYRARMKLLQIDINNII